MGLRVFPVAGEALNFGARRMETIARIAWLPVVLLLIVNMTTVFAYISVGARQVVTFAEIQSFFGAQQLLAQYAARGWSENPQMMGAITVGNLFVQTILIASFMAPLIRYSGLGERPGPGLIRLPFGPDQIRYVIAGIFSSLFVAVLIFTPIAAATFYVLQYIVDAMSQTMASFPDANSLHTISIVTAGDTLAARGASWIFNLAVPVVAVVPFVFLVWLLGFLHFSPRNRPAAPERGAPFLRGLAVLAVVAIIIGAAFWLARTEIINVYSTAKGASGGAVDVSAAPLNALLILGAAAYLIVSYFNLRLYPYPGVAVCRKSLGLGNTLRVSRGWNIIRLQVTLFLISAFLLSALFFINTYALNWIASTLNLLLQASETTTRLVNSGEKAQWVLPLFIWIWNTIKILINIFWTFFSYGVVAGLYGRLYRESEIEETITPRPSSKAIWEKQ